MRICWATDYQGIGNSYGYSVHNAKAREALAAAGATFDRDAGLAVHVAPGHLFKPIAGKRNVLYTAWEMEALPPRYVQAYAQADAVVVTASFLVDVVRRHLPNKPVHLCWEGVDTQTYYPVRRRKPVGKPFRFLWIGAPNARKGWEIVTQAWRPFFGDGRFELCLKTTVTDKLVREGNMVFDSRRLPTADLARLYREAHCFLFPSFGEGFGLTMAEAMATGLPVIYTPWSAMVDLAPPDGGFGFPLKHRLVPVQVQNNGGLVRVGDPTDGRAVQAELAQADPNHLAEQMLTVWRRYTHATKRGRKAAARIRSHFTWAHTGRRLSQILKEVSTCPQAETCAASTT